MKEDRAGRKAAPSRKAPPAPRSAGPQDTPDATALGASIRSTRMLKGLTLRDMALQIGCSESLLSKIENARVSPTIAVLGKIAQSLQVPVAALFSPIDHRHIVSRAGERTVMPLHGSGSQVERLVRPDGGHLLEGNLHTLAPGSGSGGSLWHEGEEVGYVIAGKFELTVGHEVFLLGPGDSFNFRSEIDHSYRNPGTLPARILWVSTPSRGAGIEGRRRARRERGMATG